MGPLGETVSLRRAGGFELLDTQQCRMGVDQVLLAKPVSGSGDDEH